MIPVAKRIQATNFASRLHGVTLMESLVASVVLAIAAVVNSLARELMEEIVAKPLAPPTTGNVAGWKGGNKDRTTYDSTSDFNAYADVSPFKSIGGKSVDPGTGQTYTRTVSFEYRSSPSTAFEIQFGAASDESYSAGLASVLADPMRSLCIAVMGASVLPLAPSPTEATSDFGFVVVKVTSSSGRYVMLNRLVCNTTYQK
jgi:prepilin-type N-terminal cleavage/methylation domain-containing protein